MTSWIMVFISPNPHRFAVSSQCRMQISFQRECRFFPCTAMFIHSRKTGLSLIEGKSDLSLKRGGPP